MNRQALGRHNENITIHNFSASVAKPAGDDQPNLKINLLVLSLPCFNSQSVQRQCHNRQQKNVQIQLLEEVRRNQDQYNFQIVDFTKHVKPQILVFGIIRHSRKTTP